MFSRFILQSEISLATTTVHSRHGTRPQQYMYSGVGRKSFGMEARQSWCPCNLRDDLVVLPARPGYGYIRSQSGFSEHSTVREYPDGASKTCRNSCGDRPVLLTMFLFNSTRATPPSCGRFRRSRSRPWSRTGNGSTLVERGTRFSSSMTGMAQPGYFH